MLDKETTKEKEIERLAEIMWIRNNKNEPFENVLARTYEQICAMLIAEKIVKNNEWETNILYPFVKTDIKEVIPLFRKNILEWVNDEPLTDIEYRGWTLSAIMQKRNCDFYEAATVMSTFIESGDKSSNDFPIRYRTEPMYY